MHVFALPLISTQRAKSVFSALTNAVLYRFKVDDAVDNGILLSPLPSIVYYRPELYGRQIVPVSKSRKIEQIGT